MNTQDDPTAQDPQTTAGTTTPQTAPAEREAPDTATPEAAPAGRPTSPDGAEPTDATETGTAVFVRRGRTPALGLWVAICLAVPAVGALLASPFLGLPDLPSVLNLILLAIMFVGVPLAAIAALIDALRHRGPRTPRS